MLKKIAISCICMLTLACSPKKSPTPQEFSLVQSSSTELAIPDAVRSKIEKNIYILVQQGKEDTSLVQKALAYELRQKGFTVATHPSIASYILYLNITNDISILDDTYQNLLHKGGYTAPAPQKSNATASTVLVADVLVAVRTLPKGVRSRPAVVTTASKNTTVAETCTRMFIFNGTYGETWHADAATFLAKQVAKIFP